jgi:hypothetical protein
MAVGVEGPVINQLRADFGAFTCNILGSDLVSLSFSVHNKTDFSAKKEYVSVLVDQPGANTYSI